jgi:hypothetical protein
VIEEEATKYSQWFFFLDTDYQLMVLVFFSGDYIRAGKTVANNTLTEILTAAN